MDLKYANEYDERGARAVYAVLLEIGQVLGAYRERFVIIGGSVPWLLYPDAQPAHVGTMDVDLSLDAEALGDGEYRDLVELLEGAGYTRSAPGMRFFQLQRLVDLDGAGAITVIVDLLMPREARFEKNKPPLLASFAVQRADGAGVAMRSYLEHRLDGRMPDGRPNSLLIRVASIPALLVMKGYALAGRDKQKDSYDIYFSVRQFEGGPEALANECQILRDDPVAQKAFQNIAEKFAAQDAYGPVTVRRFLSESTALGDMTEDQVQVDAYEQVNAWLKALGY